MRCIIFFLISNRQYQKKISNQFEFDSNRDSGMNIPATGAQELQKNRKDCTKTKRTARILTHAILSVLYVLEVPV